MGDTSRNGVLHRKVVLNGQDFLQFVLPPAFQENIFTALHGDLGHLGRDSTMSLIKQRFYWPGMDTFIKNKVTSCGGCIRRKAGSDRSELLSHFANGDCVSWLPFPREVERWFWESATYYRSLFSICPSHTYQKWDRKEYGQGLEQHHTIRWVMVRWWGLIRPYCKCWEHLRIIRRVIGRHTSPHWSTPTTPHSMIAPAFYLISWCLGATPVLRNELNRAYCRVSARLKCQF